MTETNRIRTLVATLRDALHALAVALGRTQDDIDAIDTQAVRLREGLAVLGTLRRQEDTPVGIDMVIDAATDLLQAFHDLESALPDAEADIETLEGELTKDEDAWQPTTRQWSRKAAPVD